MAGLTVRSAFTYIVSYRTISNPHDVWTFDPSARDYCRAFWKRKPALTGVRLGSIVTVQNFWGAPGVCSSAFPRLWP